MSSSVINQILLVTCMFVLFYTGLHIAKVVRSSVKSKTELTNHCILLLGALVLVLAIGMHLLTGLAIDGTRGILIFSLCLSLVLAGCSDALYKSMKKIGRLDAANKHANLDKLTGIYNRRYIEERLEAEVSRSKRYSSPLAVVVIDIGNFHRFNTVYGFQSGDLLLKTAASIINSSIRDSDAVARYNAKSFIVVLSDTPESNITAVTDRLQSRLVDGFQSIADITKAYASSNVKFGKACCDLSTRSGIELINTALEHIQAEKNPLNKQDTAVVTDKSGIEKPLEQAA